jgi:hypothetical protein
MTGRTMMVLASVPRRVEHAFDVTIQRSHHTYSGEHRWPVMFCNEGGALASRLAIRRRRARPSAVSRYRARRRVA